ncbi:MAG: RagB/SusD family nutrient uptake outer membrane protein [Cytophagales bacterium]|jgi:tetratricopeptide (TPR) repeat protein|nr:RagB/SusD family nutrient uptake outer membrane protein [Cytophagales bacterium]
MKGISIKIVLFLSGIALVANSCRESELDLQPGFINEESFFGREIDYDRGVRGIYSKMTDWYWFNNNSPIHGLWHLPGDDITTVGNNAFEIFGPVQPANGAVNGYYTTAYIIVNRANTMLEKLQEAAPDVYTTPGLKDRHRGETLFLRGLTYFNLWNHFGSSPLITERIRETAQTRRRNAQGNSLLDQAIKDLEEAAGLLPARWDTLNRGRVTANAANGLLGKALLFRATVASAQADYQAALAAFNKITDASLVPDFGDNFAADRENNAESLFEFQASQSLGDNVWLPNDFGNATGSMSTYWGFYENHWSMFGTPPYIATRKLITAFEPGDPRRNITLDSATRAIRKYVQRDRKAGNGVGSLNNPRILRYADVLLLKAEALVRSGGPLNEAIGLVNQVRTRARNMRPGGTVPADRPSAETNRDQVMRWIMEERFIELAGEETRWFDLKRWSRANLVTLNNAFFDSANALMSFNSQRDLLLPIPTGEIDLNPDITQNPGY